MSEDKTIERFLASYLTSDMSVLKMVEGNPQNTGPGD